MVDKKDLERAKQVKLEVCFRLKPVKDPWLVKWGNDRDGWVAQDQQYRARSVAASKAAWRRLKKKAEEHQFLFGFKCELGHEQQTTRELLGGPQPFGEHYTVAYCDKQDTCKDYRSVDQALIDLAKHPKGSA